MGGSLTGVPQRVTVMMTAAATPCSPMEWGRRCRMGTWLQAGYSQVGGPGQCCSCEEETTLLWLQLVDGLVAALILRVACEEASSAALHLAVTRALCQGRPAAPGPSFSPDPRACGQDRRDDSGGTCAWLWPSQVLTSLCSLSPAWLPGHPAAPAWQPVACRAPVGPRAVGPVPLTLVLCVFKTKTGSASGLSPQ